MIKAIARRSLLAFVPVFVLCLCIIQSPSLAKTWRVGPTRTYAKPSLVMSLVADGDTVLIDSGLYVKDVGVWRAKRLVLQCPKGLAHLDAEGTAAARKGIWVIDGDSTYVEGIEFSGCAISDADGSNGAGIRFESHKLECRRCYFHDNQEGILTGNDTTNEITIEACEFDHNGVETGANAGYQHNIYVGHSRVCRIAFCYFHRSIVGHEIKSRANRNYILYNYIVDGPDGDGSYSIDLPNGGLGDIIGNVIEKGPRTANSTVVSYGEEGLVNPEKRFFFNSNTVVTDRQPAIFLHIADGSDALVANNIFAGGTHLLVGTADTMNNAIHADTAFFHFRNPLAYDYHVIAPFGGADTVALMASEEGLILWPRREYVHPLDSSSESLAQPHHIGAFAPFYTAGVAEAVRDKKGLAFPNPFTTSTSITLPNFDDGQVTLEILNSLGERVYQSTVHPGDAVVRLERHALPAGVYHYVVTHDSTRILTGTLVAQ